MRKIIIIALITKISFSKQYIFGVWWRSYASLEDVTSCYVFAGNNFFGNNFGSYPVSEKVHTVMTREMKVRPISNSSNIKARNISHSTLGWRARIKLNIDKVDRNCPELSKNQRINLFEREATNHIC